MELIKFNSKIKMNDKNDNIIKQFNGADYLVLPMVMLVEGVLNGGLYPLDEMIKSISSWNGRPSTLDHPQIDGIPVSANTPLILENTQIGFVFNSKIEGNKLIAEAWIEAIHYDTIKNTTEVSTGLFVDSEYVTGEFNGEEYDYIAHNFKPDHLALLPGKTGACSNVDGCGITINEKKEDNLIKKGEIKTNAEDCKCNELLANEEKNDKFPLVNWFKVHVLQKFTGQLKANEASFDAKWDLVRAALRKKFKTDENWVGVEAMFDTFVIFWIEENSGWKFYKINYTISENDTMAVLSGEKVEVMPKLTYEPVNSSILTNEDNKPIEEPKDEDIKDNDDNKQNGGDSVKDHEKGEESPKTNEVQTFSAEEVAKIADDAATKAVSAYKANEAKTNEETTKKNLVSSIVANEKCNIPETALEKFTVNELEDYSNKLGAPTPDYSGNDGGKIKGNEKTKASSVESVL